MESLETKKLALIRIWQIFKEHSDYDHPLTQEEIADYLERDYGIIMERKAISRNMSLLKEAGIEIESGRNGSYLDQREFEDSELHMLIDGVLCSKYITAKHSKDLIERLCGLSNKYFKAHVKNIHSVNDWSKTDNQALFYNIELIDTAIERGKQLHYDYNKYGLDKKLHKTSQQYVSPYQMILHNQHYYLMAYSEYWGNMVFHRLDYISNMTITDQKAFPLKKVKGYEKGINYKELSSAMPYMYTDKPEEIEFLAETSVIDQIIDWFGRDIRIMPTEDETKVKVCIKASPKAMEHWAMQYINYVEITSPEALRTKIRDTLKAGLKKYK
ncbi:MAG: WYL domain-containing transcriptional regulator [Parasporobacterium sp.]|nr:WYL domain-containing transcriptional regulator [Parasporobacterium sp.]